MEKFVVYIKKFVVTIVGVPLLIVGIILIPLPGPGLLVCFAALFILSLGFDDVKPYTERLKTEFKKISQKSKARTDRIAGKKDK